MNTKLPIILLFLACHLGAQAAPRTSANYSIGLDSLDVGGLRAASASYTHDGSAGTIAGMSAVATPPATAKHGYVGQLFDVAGLIVNAAAPTVDETGTLQLGAWHLLDDATFLAVPAAAVSWNVVSGPILSISSEGLASAGVVYQDTLATVQGVLASLSGTFDFSVLDSIADNFGSYAGDALADDWQVLYFGLDNPLAAPGLDPDGDGQTNAFEFTAGLLPTDSDSVFRLRIEAVPGFPDRKNLIFNPRLDDRTYTVVAKPALLPGGSWDPIVAGPPSDNGAERTITDLEATGWEKFYRVRITSP